MTGSLRHPRGALQVQGGNLPFVECTVTLSRHASSDEFTATVLMDAVAGLDDYWAAQQKNLDASVLFMVDSDSRTMIEANVDHIEFDYKSRILHFSGRDKSKGLIDKTTHEKWLNKKSQDIITDLAGRHGLGVDFGSSSTAIAGKIYQIDHNALTDKISEWSMVQRLADLEGLIAYVKDSTLFLRPVNDNEGNFFVVNYTRPTPQSYASGNWIELKVTKSLQLAKPVKVKVSSWSHKQKKALTAEKDLGGGDGEPLIYDYRIPGITQDQADRIAQKRLDQNTQPEIQVEVDMPGDLGIDARDVIQLQGTALDQIYYIDQIEHRMSQSDGYRMTVSAKSKDASRS